MNPHPLLLAVAVLAATLKIITAADPSSGLSSGWHPISDCLVARWNHAMATTGGTTYAIGGFGPTAAVSGYKPATHAAWAAEPSLYRARANLAAAALNGTLYALGGTDGRTVTSLVETSFLGGVWSHTAAPMLHARQAFGAAAVAGKIVAVGGCGTTGCSIALASAEVFDPATNTWTAAAPMATPRAFHAVAALGALVYAMGGCSGGVCAKVEAYDLSSDAWAPVADMANKRWGAAAAAAHGQLYIMGGTDGSLSTDVEAFSPVAKKWKDAQSMGTARGNGFAAAALGNVVFVTGGDDSTGTTAEALAC